jgi:predicted DNA-binding protein
VRGMEKDAAVFLPPQLVARVDAVANAETRSRANTVKWLLDRSLRQREAAEVAAEPVEAS